MKIMARAENSVSVFKDFFVETLAERNRAIRLAFVLAIGQDDTTDERAVAMIAEACGIEVDVVERVLGMRGKDE